MGAGAAGPLCVYLHGVHDPGNVGAVLRSALAFGASSVAFGPDTADPFGPKAVRASMGAVFSVPLAQAVELRRAPGHEGCAGLGSRRSAGGAASRTADHAVDRGGAEGLPDEVIAAADRVAHIPIETESLNAAMAATIALYELKPRPD